MKFNWNGNTNKNKSAIVLFSGGLDSSVLLIKALNEYPKVLAIGFDYGQRNKNELQAAKKIASDLNVDFRILNANFISQLSPTNWLLNNDKTKDAKHEEVIVPYRNGFFIEMACVIAYNENYSDVLLGGLVDENTVFDKSIYFIKNLNKSINSGLYGKETKIKISMPFSENYMVKRHIWKLAEQYGVLEYIKENIVTCYNGAKGLRGCGKCSHCKRNMLEYQIYEIRNKK